MRAKKVYNETIEYIIPRTREPGVMCRGKIKSSLDVVEIGILCLRLSRGLDVDETGPQGRSFHTVSCQK